MFTMIPAFTVFVHCFKANTLPFRLLSFLCYLFEYFLFIQLLFVLFFPFFFVCHHISGYNCNCNRELFTDMENEYRSVSKTRTPNLKHLLNVIVRAVSLVFFVIFEQKTTNKHRSGKSFEIRKSKWLNGAIKCSCFWFNWDVKLNENRRRKVIMLHLFNRELR